VILLLILGTLSMFGAVPEYSSLLESDGSRDGILGSVSQGYLFLLLFLMLLGAGARLNVFLNRVRWADRSSAMLTWVFCCWSVPFLIYGNSTTLVFLDWILVIVMVRLLSVDSMASAMRTAFIVGVVSGVMFMWHPSAILLLFFAALTLKDIGFFNWRILAWLILGTVFPLYLTTAVEFVSTGQVTSFLSRRSVVSGSFSFKGTEWLALGGLVLGLSLVLVSLYSAFIGLNKKVSHERMLIRAVFRLLGLCTLLLIWYSGEGAGVVGLGLLAVPFSILVTRYTPQNGRVWPIIQGVWILSTIAYCLSVGLEG